LVSHFDCYATIVMLIWLLCWFVTSQIPWTINTFDSDSVHGSKHKQVYRVLEASMDIFLVTHYKDVNQD